MNRLSLIPYLRSNFHICYYFMAPTFTNTAPGSRSGGAGGKREGLGVTRDRLRSIDTRTFPKEQRYTLR